MMEGVIVVEYQACVEADMLCLSRETWQAQAQATSSRTREQCHQAKERCRSAFATRDDHENQRGCK